MLEVQIKGADKLRAIAKALREADRVDLKRELGKELQGEAKPTLDALQRSAEGISTTGISKPGAKRPFTKKFASKGTRSKIAGSLVAEVRIDEDSPRITFASRSSRLPAELKNMPRKFDTEGTFRHPIMGQDSWVGQTGSPWFWAPIRDRIKEFRAAASRAIDTVRDKLERS